VTAGQVLERTRAESVIEQALNSGVARRRRKNGKRCQPRKLVGDKGYSAAELRDWLTDRGIQPVIPHKANEAARLAASFDAEAYRQRSVVEQCVGWLKEYRRIGTRFEKPAVNYHAMLQLANVAQ